MMDALEFLNKVDRLSTKGTTEEKVQYNEYRENRDNASAVAFVEKWAAEHPIKTRQSEFLKMFPEADVDDTGDCLALPPCNFYKKMLRECSGRKCSDCRKAFWLAEVEE